MFNNKWLRVQWQLIGDPWQHLKRMELPFDNHMTPLATHWPSLTHYCKSLDTLYPLVEQIWTALEHCVQIIDNQWTHCNTLKLKYHRQTLSNHWHVIEHRRHILAEYFTLRTRWCTSYTTNSDKWHIISTRWRIIGRTWIILEDHCDISDNNWTTIANHNNS